MHLEGLSRDFLIIRNKSNINLVRQARRTAEAEWLLR